MAGMQDLQMIVFGQTGTVKLTLSIWVAASVLTLASLLLGILVWRQRWWRLAGRIWLSVILVGAAGCVLWLNHWNLLGWKY